MNNYRSLTTFDLCTGRIAIYVRGSWRWAFVAPGYVTLASGHRPNHHVGIGYISDVVKDTQSTFCRDVASSPHLMLGARLTEDEVSSVEKIKYGRTAKLRTASGIVDAWIHANIPDRDDLLAR